MANCSVRRWQWLAAALIFSALVAFIAAGAGPQTCDRQPAPGINWESCDKARVSLHGADLRGANLLSANLTEANLSAADLRDANLRLSKLRRTDLRGADLRGADLRYADLRETQFDWVATCAAPTFRTLT